MAQLRRDELPEQLRPLFDELTLELHRVHDISHQLRALRRSHLLLTGALAASAAITIAIAVSRALT